MGNAASKGISSRAGAPRLTRALPLFVLFGAVVVADGLLARMRGVSVQRLTAAFLLATSLLWGLGALLGWIGSRLAYGAESSGLPGALVGATLGGIAGATLGIALADRAMTGDWTRRGPLLLAAAALIVLASFTLAVFVLLSAADQRAGPAVFATVPLLGAGALLGWLLGLENPLP